MNNRKEVTAWFLKKIEELQPSNKNIEMYNAHFAEMDDTTFSELMKRLATGEITLPYYAPAFSSKDVEISEALKVADSLNINFFQKLWLTDPVSGVKYQTNKEYFIVDLPVRRQAQHVTKGRSVTESSSKIDSLTGQPTGESQSSRMSLPEIMNLEAMGLHKNIHELIDVRGGNELAFREAKRSMLTNGSYSLQQTDEIGSRATSTLTLKAFLLGMHLNNNL